ncbi:hypothetical protein ACIRG5_42465 [Lentzea sp. NPDC102401]|uniref:hypothetical protein n=1 Tax=Lentzea sp. NPDC102401 TaxID=3364128 RepID=UPI00380A55CA
MAGLGPWSYALIGAAVALISAAALCQLLEMATTETRQRPTPLAGAAIALLTVGALTGIAIAITAGGGT